MAFGLTPTVHSGSPNVELTKLYTAETKNRKVYDVTKILTDLKLTPNTITRRKR